MERKFCIEIYFKTYFCFSACSNVLSLDLQIKPYLCVRLNIWILDTVPYATEVS